MSNWMPNEWYEWGSAEWQESWNDWGSSWWGDGWQQTSRSEQKKEAAIKASHDSEMLVLRKKPNSILVYTS